MIVKICGLTNLADARTALRLGSDWIGLNLVAGPRMIDLQRALDIVRELYRPTEPAPSEPGVRRRRTTGFGNVQTSPPMADPNVETSGGMAKRSAAMPLQTATTVDRSAVVALVNVDDARCFDDTIETLALVGVRRFQLYGFVDFGHVARLRERGLDVIHVVQVADAGSWDVLDAFMDRCGQSPPSYVLIDAAPPVGTGGSARILGGTGRPADWDLLERAIQSGRTAAWPPIVLAGGLNPANVAQAIRRLQPAGVDVSSGVESAPGVKDPERVRAFVDAARQAG